MKNYWKWLQIFALCITVFFFFKYLKENMEAIKLFLNHINPFIVVLPIAIFFSLWRLKLWLNEKKNKKFSPGTKAILSPNESVEILKDGNKHYLVKGKTCHHIPDEPTFNYLATLFGFSWGSAKFMPLDEIEHKFKMGNTYPVFDHSVLAKI